MNLTLLIYLDEYKVTGEFSSPHAQTGLKFQSRPKQLILTTKSALGIQLDIFCVNGPFNLLGCNPPFIVFDSSALKKQLLIFLIYYDSKNFGIWSKT